MGSPAKGQSKSRLIENNKTDDLASFTVVHSSRSEFLLNVLTWIGLLCWFIYERDLILDTLVGNRHTSMWMDFEMGSCVGIFVLIIGSYFFLKGTIVGSETITFMRGIGIETGKSMVNGKSNTKFVPITRVRELILYEHIGMCKVTSQFGILIYGEDKLLLPFKTELPNSDLIRVYKIGKRTLGM